MPSDIADSLARARRERDEAEQRGDTVTARLIGQAISVLELASAGKLVPRQRQSLDDPVTEEEQ